MFEKNRKIGLAILTHISMWVLLFLLLHNEKIDVHCGPFIRTNDNLLIPLIYGLGFGAVIFYATIYRLIPTYFVGKNKSTFWIKSLLLVLGVSGIGTYS